MIEIVYEKEKQKPEGNEEFFRIPNNIRQIGEVGGIQEAEHRTDAQRTA